MPIADFALGGYRFIPGVFQYSGGVAALPGYEIQRVRFRQPVPLALGFERIAHWLHGAGRPLTSFCACELRSPAPFTEDGFRAFNKIYVVTLGEWGLFDGTVNPVARSNVCPEIDPPAEPCFHAFSYTVDVPDAPPSFVISGSGEAREGGATYQERTIRRGETTQDAMREKAQFVLDVLGERLKYIGLGWADTTATQVYTVHNLHPFLADEIVRRGAAHAGLTWHFARPPVRELEFEVDCRGVSVERVV